jgi:hypothetical protein
LYDVVAELLRLLLDQSQSGGAFAAHFCGACVREVQCENENEAQEAAKLYSFVDDWSMRCVASD